MRVFISYRRDDSESVVHRLHERLCWEFDEDDVFLDTKGGLRGGDEWFHKIRERLYQADALLAVIGRHWLSDANAARLGDPEDVLRQEVEIALGRGILVIPVLVDRATMPEAGDLPESMARLAGKQWVELSNQKFDRDVEDLLGALLPERVGDSAYWSSADTGGGGAVGPETVHLGAVLPGTWAQRVQYPNGVVGQATAQYFPNGTFQIQGSTPMGPFQIHGTWTVDGFDQLWMSGQSRSGFQVTPFSTSARFSHISPGALAGSLSSGEHLEWQRVG